MLGGAGSSALRAFDREGFVIMARPFARCRGIGSPADRLFLILVTGDVPRKTGSEIPMVVEIFGIKACDTMKKARAFLEAQGIDYVFHDYKVEGVTADRLSAWAAAVGWETLLNTSGTTFRKLSEADRQDLTEAKAIALMVAHPSLIKRPVLTRRAEILVGFKPETYSRLIG